jgi:hypothetical protein
VSDANHRAVIAIISLWVGASMAMVIHRPTHPRLASLAASVIAMVVAHKADDHPYTRR